MSKTKNIYTKVTLRQKPISGNRESLYLDFYPAIIDDKGNETRRQFLGLYLFHTANPNKFTGKKLKEYLERMDIDFITYETMAQMELDKNKHTYMVACVARDARYKEVISRGVLSDLERRAEIQIKKQELEQSEKDTLKDQEQMILDENFLKYFELLARKRSGTNHDNWHSAVKYFDIYCKGKCIMRNITESFCNDFKSFLMKAPSRKSSKVTLSNNSAVSYFNKFKATLKQAYKDGFLKDDINSKIDCIKTIETSSIYLTMEEVNKLVNTPCDNDVLKRASLFTVLTGIRHVDVKNLVWANVYFETDEGYSLNFIEQKTGSVHDNLPISSQAFSLMGERGEPDKKIFKGLVYSASTSKDLAKWAKDAGINKAITYHKFRHTYAILQLSNGTDIYTVSKMMGHSSVTITARIYAKIVDETKRKASEAFTIDM
jgi:site-specific recombinase XerD